MIASENEHNSDGIKSVKDTFPRIRYILCNPLYNFILCRLMGSGSQNKAIIQRGKIYRKKMKYELKNARSVTQRKFEQHVLFTTAQVLLMSPYMFSDSFLISVLCNPFYNHYTFNKHLSWSPWFNWGCDFEPDARVFPGQDYLLFTIKVEQLRIMNAQVNQTIPTIFCLQCVTAALCIVIIVTLPVCWSLHVSRPKC